MVCTVFLAGIRVCRLSIYTRCSKKWRKVLAYGTIILQAYIIVSCGFQQNVHKEIFYVTEVNV